ncbi:hypothetical protein [Flavobacterium sp.]|nr:hypothetical protein [Flavobacterium sp.]
MAKIYTSKPLAASKMLPKKETINFLLSYSKALTIQKKGNMVFESIAN